MSFWEKYARVCVYILPTSVSARLCCSVYQPASAACTRHMGRLLFMSWQSHKFATLKLPYFTHNPISLLFMPFFLAPPSQSFGDHNL